MPKITDMKTLILWTITILGLSGLFLLANAPFIGALFLLLLLIIAITGSHQKRQSTLQPMIWVYPKIVLAAIFLVSVGYSVHLYLKSIRCVSCMHGILSANLPISLSFAQENPIAFAKGMWAFNNRVSFVFLFMGGLLVIDKLIRLYQKQQKKGRKHV